jgi:hypothetical protein
LEDEQLIRSEETTKGCPLANKKSETKTQSEYKIQGDDELSIENDIPDGNPRFYTR